MRPYFAVGVNLYFIPRYPNIYGMPVYDDVSFSLLISDFI